MASLENRTVEDGNVIGHVRTNRVGSDCEFAICSVAEWEEMTEDEANQALLDAAFESGQFEIW